MDELQIPKKIKLKSQYNCGICKKIFFGSEYLSHKSSCAPKMSHVRYAWTIKMVRVKKECILEASNEKIVPCDSGSQLNKKTIRFKRKYPNSRFTFASDYNRDDEKAINIAIGRKAFFPKKT